MPKAKPKPAAKGTEAVRRRGPQRPRGNPTRNGKIFGNWQDRIRRSGGK